MCAVSFEGNPQCVLYHLRDTIPQMIQHTCHVPLKTSDAVKCLVIYVYMNESCYTTVTRTIPVTQTNESCYRCV